MLAVQVLRFMHQHNIVHRDIKPDNFVLPYGSDPLNPTPDDTVYVVDMGMAQQISPDGECGALCQQLCATLAKAYCTTTQLRRWQRTCRCARQGHHAQCQAKLCKTALVKMGLLSMPTRAGFDWEAQDCLYMGTVDYSSVRALRGYNPSGWDDLESLAIALLEMATGESLLHLTRAQRHMLVGSCGLCLALHAAARLLQGEYCRQCFQALRLKLPVQTAYPVHLCKPQAMCRLTSCKGTVL